MSYTEIAETNSLDTIVNVFVNLEYYSVSLCLLLKNIKIHIRKKLLHKSQRATQVTLEKNWSIYKSLEIQTLSAVACLPLTSRRNRMSFLEKQSSFHVMWQIIRNMQEEALCNITGCSKQSTLMKHLQLLLISKKSKKDNLIVLDLISQENDKIDQN